MNRVHHLALSFVLAFISVLAVPAAGQASAVPAPPGPMPPPDSAAGGRESGTGASTAPAADGRVRTVLEGLLHEAFLSPRRDRSPARVEKAPPPPITERPGLDPPSFNAEWIEGYW